MATTTLAPKRRRRQRAETGDLGWNGKSWRRWSGRRWARAVNSLQLDLLLCEPGPETWPKLPSDRLARGLDLAVERQVSTFAATVDHHGPNGVVLSYKRPVSHGAHLFGTLVTGGLWAIVWIVMAVDRKYDRVRLEIDSWGHVWAVPLPPR